MEIKLVQNQTVIGQNRLKIESKLNHGLYMEKPICKIRPSQTTEQTAKQTERQMVITHPSHFGINVISMTEDNVVMSGSLSACKRMAAAHGMEIEKYEGRTVSCDGSNAVYSPVDMSSPNRIVFKNGGMIQKCPDDYCLVMPVSIWNQTV